MSVCILSSFLYGEEHLQNSRFGICSHPFAHHELGIQPELFDSMKEAGVCWMRTDFHWGLIEPERGKFDFSIYDNIVDSLSNRGIKVLGILSYNARKERDAANDTKEWAEYIKKTVEHFKGRVDCWEFVNEPDLHLKGDSAVADYVKALKTTSKIVHTVNPSAKLLIAGFADPASAFAKAVIAECSAEDFDIMNFHSYPAPRPPEKVLAEKIKSARESMGMSTGEKPIWITEIGSTTPPEISSMYPLRAAVEKLGLSPKKVYAIKDSLFEDASFFAKSFFTQAEKITPIRYSQIGNLPSDSVLIVPAGETFDYNFADDLVDFVGRGGTLIYPGGGFPFFKDSDGNVRGDELLRRLRVNLVPHWTMKGVPDFIDVKRCRGAEGFEDISLKKVDGFRGFNYNSALLEAGEKFIPIVCSDTDGGKIAMAAAYKFKNGGIGVFISNKFATYVSEDAQAALLARDYMYAFSEGVEKVFIYSFRSHELVSVYEGHFGIVGKDFRRKKAFYAYKTLVEILGDSKVKYSESDGFCRANWISPQGSNVCSLWTFKNDEQINVRMAGGNFKVLDVSGKEIPVEHAKGKSFSITVNQSPIYIIGSKVEGIEF